MARINVFLDRRQLRGEEAFFSLYCAGVALWVHSSWITAVFGQCSSCVFGAQDVVYPRDVIFFAGGVCGQDKRRGGMGRFGLSRW